MTDQSTDHDVMVYAPSPVLTVTIEQHADKLSLHVHPGGQGVWQARMLGVLGARGVLCTTFGGEAGRVARELLNDETFDVRSVDRAGSSGWYVHDRRDGQRQEVSGSPGDPLDRHEIDELYNLALTEGLRSPVSVLGGPTDPSLVPPETYRRLAADLTSHGARVVADLAGEHLTAALEGGVSVLKVAHDELIADGRAADETVPALVAAARALAKEGAESVVVSRAEEPAVALLRGRMVRIEATTLEPADPRGAGDSMTAAVAAMLARGSDLEEAVRYGAAAGAVNVTRHGLGTGRADFIAELATRVQLTALPDDE